MTLLHDLLDIPERIQKGDFVLRLAEGVTRPDETLRDYVVTPELQRCFDDALTFIRSAIDSRTSKASYLHGSFGSGKSHFMAVLHLLLQGIPAARSVPELAGLVTKSDVWLKGRKFLLVPYHLIGAHDMESAILGGYVEFVRRVHPGAPLPAVFIAEGLFADAQALRRRMGDTAFFAALNDRPARQAQEGWGDLDVGWDAARFEEAIEDAPGSGDRLRLVSDLIGRLFRSYDLHAAGRREAFLSLDQGLEVMSKHAAGLGYDAVILFLDELILWLASHAADIRFVHQEGQKLAKLVEAQSADRPIPIVSFVARQRDLSELIGHAVTGSERLNFSDALRHWEGRFHRITLDDRNLPAIVEKRVLKTRGDAARRELDAAFEQTVRMRESIYNTLLTNEGDRQMFRRVYPFSPALVQTLIAVSAALQRERTALKVMMQILVEQRDTLKVGDLVPVGDLFDVIAHGDEAFSQEMAINFDNARRLYHQKLLPLLERQHGRREESDKLAYDDPKRAAFRADDRLIKTLLLAALVPEAAPLRALTAERLVALNHGSIKSPIPGKEASEALRRCNAWAAAVGEIRIGPGENPTISVQLTGVDLDAILAKAQREDNAGNRIRRVRHLLFEQLGIAQADEFFQQHDFLWRNTQRTCEVIFHNVRELPEASLAGASDQWKVVIDFPFDEPEHGPRDDIGRIQRFRDGNPQGSPTLIWLPNFFSTDALKDLGTLVILEHILASEERLNQYTSHLSPQDRQAARSLLDNQRSVLGTRVRSHLEAAYGLVAPLSGSLDTSASLEPHEQFQSLKVGFEPQSPVGPTLAKALDQLLDQALSHDYPAHPVFEAETRTAILRKLQEVMIQAAATEDGRVPVDKPLRHQVRQIAIPLLLGEMGSEATHFVLGQHWKHHFSRKIAEAGGGSVGVLQLRRWLDLPKPMGLPKDVGNLVLLAFAAQTDRTLYLHGAPFEGATLANLPDTVELREVARPAEAVWKIAVERAGAIFGISASPLPNAANVAKLVKEVEKTVVEGRAACNTYASRLRERIGSFGAPTDCARLKTALAGATLLEQLTGANAKKMVESLANAQIATSASAMGTAIKHAAELAERLDAADWDLFEALGRLADARKGQAQEIRESIRAALSADEHAVPLGPSLKEAQARAVRLLTVQPPPPPPSDAREDRKPPPPPPGWRLVEQDRRSDLALEAAKDLLRQVESRLKKGQRAHLNMEWRIEEQSSGP